MKAAVLPLLVILVLTGCARPEPRSAQDAEAVVLEDFEFLVGSWEGTLDYLDYGDDRTRVELPAEVTYRRDDALRFDFVFTEPSGETMTDGGTLVISETGEIVTGGETYRLVRKAFDPEAGTYEIVFAGLGMDNNRAATITHTVERRGDALVIQKHVVYDDLDEPLLRHEFRFTR